MKNLRKNYAEIYKKIMRRGNVIQDFEFSSLLYSDLIRRQHQTKLESIIFEKKQIAKAIGHAGSIILPDLLQSYMNNKTIITNL